MLSPADQNWFRDQIKRPRGGQRKPIEATFPLDTDLREAKRKLGTKTAAYAAVADRDGVEPDSVKKRDQRQSRKFQREVLNIGDTE